MIVPNRQTGNVQDLTREELAEIMQTAQRAMKALDGLMHPNGYNFGANFGRTAGGESTTMSTFTSFPGGMGTRISCRSSPIQR